jgi:hypothetical protein
MKMTAVYDRKTKKSHLEKDYRGDVLWEKATGDAFVCNYIGDMDVSQTDVPPPDPFYHDWDETSNSWIENSDKKKNYLITQLDIKSDEIFKLLHRALIAAIGDENTQLEQEIKDEISTQEKIYNSELSKIQSGTAITIPSIATEKRCLHC